MPKLIIVGSGITGLITALKYSGDVIILEKNKIVANNSKASLWSIIPPLCSNHREDCEKGMRFYEEICEKYGIYCKKTHILRVSSKKIGGKIVDRKEIRGLEPQLNIEEAEFFENGLFVEGDELFSILETEFNIKSNSEVTDILVKDNEIKSLLTSKGEVKGEFYIFATGYLTPKLFSKLGIEVNLFKGHLIITKKTSLNGILIVNDRIAVEGKKLYLNGDSKQNSSMTIDYDEISKTINEIGRVLKIDTTNLEIRVGFRSVSKDREPIVKKIYSNAILITGYRFGFALAPVLAEKAIQMIKYGH
ncbi:FAD dependent oxidoreductase [Sulfolobus islandicus L.S.2.15]|uniref:FAD dependent oxidoreductase n=1 Tax=Saccharolobus islandicus (strain L.S.2.15 / Lassen \|nr:FAD-dependent oxidoreductase [Sulfolobus islandicus]ACP34205.1 FAD dependent oxidoreductase [Sulfolobus islandicus L.S.2.15]